MSSSETRFVQDIIKLTEKRIIDWTLDEDSGIYSTSFAGENITLNLHYKTLNVMERIVNADPLIIKELTSLLETGKDYMNYLYKAKLLAAEKLLEEGRGFNVKKEVGSDEQELTIKLAQIGIFGKECKPAITKLYDLLPERKRRKGVSVEKQLLENWDLLEPSLKEQITWENVK
jgi:hypothetical protein